MRGTLSEYRTPYNWSTMRSCLKLKQNEALKMKDCFLVLHMIDGILVKHNLIAYCSCNWHPFWALTRITLGSVIYSDRYDSNCLINSCGKVDRPDHTYNFTSSNIACHLSKEQNSNVTSASRRPGILVYLNERVCTQGGPFPCMPIENYSPQISSGTSIYEPSLKYMTPPAMIYICKSRVWAGAAHSSLFRFIRVPKRLRVIVDS